MEASGENQKLLGSRVSRRKLLQAGAVAIGAASVGLIACAEDKDAAKATVRSSPASPTKLDLRNEGSVADSAEVICLVDNFVDLAMGGSESVRRPVILPYSTQTAGSAIPTDAAPFMGPGRITRTLRAEHGFSALISLTVDGENHSVLLDTGMSLDGLGHNAEILGLDLSTIEALILSHGHLDHTAGLGYVAGKLEGRGIPLIAHPDAWLERRTAIPGGAPIELPPARRDRLEEAGFEIRESKSPVYLFGGALLATGEVERTTEFERGLPFHETKRDGRWEADPLIWDDQAVVLNVRGKGLVIVTGCAHSGVINTLRHAVRLTGVERVHAVIGGFHLTGPVFEPVIAPTVDAMSEIGLQVIVPMHCTGWKAIHAFAAAMPEAFVQNSAGTTYLF